MYTERRSSSRTYFHACHIGNDTTGCYAQHTNSFVKSELIAWFAADTGFVLAVEFGYLLKFLTTSLITGAASAPHSPRPVDYRAGYINETNAISTLLTSRRLDKT